MRIGNLVTAVLLAAAAVSGAAAGPAAAATTQHWIDSDGFEGNPWNRWERLADGDGVAGADIGKGLAHNGFNNGWLYAAHGWAAERMRVQVDSWTGRQSCRASIWVSPVGTDAQVELQIWDPNGWRMLTSVAPRLQGDRYQQIVTGPVDLGGVGAGYVQAIFGKSDGAGQFARIDDAVLECV